MSMEYRNVVTTEPGVVEGEKRFRSSGGWYKFTADLDLFRIDLAIDRGGFEEIWATQDGYGIVGHTPPQGYDWSGVRDSTPCAIEAMVEIAKKYVSDEEVEAVLGIRVFA